MRAHVRNRMNMWSCAACTALEDIVGYQAGELS
jgi:hypothetical protein